MTALSRGGGHGCAIIVGQHSCIIVAQYLVCRVIAGPGHGAGGRCYLDLLGRQHADLHEEGASHFTTLSPAIAPHLKSEPSILRPEE